MKEVNRVILLATEVIERTQDIMRNWAESLIPEAKRNEPQPDVDFEERSEELVRLGTAVTSSHPTNAGKYTDTAAFPRVENSDLDKTLRIAKLVRDNAEKFAEEEIVQR